MSALSFSRGSTTGLNLGIREQVKAWLQQRGIIYHDWNVVNGDGATVTADEAYHNVVDNIVQRTHPIVLMHDGVKKETTWRLFQELLRHYRVGDLRLHHWILVWSQSSWY